jgi:hypothetical protein
LSVKHGLQVHGGDHLHSTTNQISRKRRQPIILILGPSVFDRDIPALDKASGTDLRKG